MKYFIKKVNDKLMLVSRDIQVSDMITVDKSKGKVISITGLCAEIDLGWSSTQTKPLSDCIKIVGEISPEAMWIKEGDEFTEENIAFYTISIVEGWENHTDYNTWVNSSYNKEIRIKCPTCGHFH